MSTIVATNMRGTGQRTLTYTALNGISDTFSYFKGRNQVLILRNDSGGPLNPIIDGDGATTVECSGVGSIDVSGGYDVGSIADGDAVAIPLNSISAYLAGTIDITGATGIDAALMEF